MIPQIKELNFPAYATLQQATVTINDMGDRTITADIKIDGAITPDFSYDWEVEFKGDKYIQPLRKPQGSKGDKSSMSTINLTFYHWAIYQLKRYFFVELASTQAGTAFADKYIVPLSVNLGEFVVAFNNVLSYYFPDGDIYIDLNPDWPFDAERKYIDINNTYLWDVLQKTHELFSVRWVMERDTNGKYAIRIGYPAGELTHIFEYGFEGGLLNIERQVQDANIRNKILGRGGSKNIPYLYFKDYDKYPQGGDGNQSMIPDPDAIPELSNIYFSELRDSNFRSYVQGWKTNANRLLIEGDTLNEFDADRAETDYAYMRGATDTKFDPVEYVKDDASIAEYGELVGRLENNEDIYPSLQGMNIELTDLDGNTFVTRADEVVAVQEVNTDSIASDEAEVKSDIKLEAKSQTSHGAGSDTFTASAQTITISSDEIEIPEGYEGTLFDAPTIKYTLEWKERIKQYMQYKAYSEGDKVSANTYKQGDKAFPSVSYKVIDVITNKEVTPINLPEGRYRVDYTLNFPSVTLGSGIIHAQQTPSGLGQTERLKVYWLKRNVTTSAAIICKSFNGDVILNKVDGVAISKSVSVGANSKATVSITGDTFSVPAQGAIMVDVPISVTPAATTTYSEKTIKVVNANTNEIVPATNIPEGEYKLLVDVALINESSSAKTLKVELLPSNLYFADNTEKWEPTFDVWIKNIFNTKKSDYASEAAYVEGVWSPLRTEDEMVLTFSSGNLSGHDGWEFKVKKDGIAYDNSRVIVDANGNEVRSEWRLTLIKSDAELETIKKYIPYKDFNAKAGDTFFFTGIILPHQYVLSAEKDVTSWKQDNLAEVKDIKPQWVISLDKVRAHREDADRLIDLLHVGAVLTLKDQRFTKNVDERQILQSITFEWHETSLLPAVDVVLSDKVTTSLSTVAMLQGKVESLIKSVAGLSNIEQIVRRVGDALYLRKDGFEETSYSPTKFAQTVSSEDFHPGSVGGVGWAAYSDENGMSVIEADKLFVRNEMHVNSLIINQISAMGGINIISAADMKISAVESVVLADGSVGDKCFFETNGASKSNMFAVDDIAYSNMFDSDNAELKYYKRRVIEVGENYITLSTIEKDGEGTPQEGDVIVQFGNFTDESRQNAIVIAAYGSNAPSIVQYKGINSFVISDDNIVTKLSSTENIFTGIVHIQEGSDGFGELGDFAEIIQETVRGVEVGGQNMLRNSGFTGDYLSAQLADEVVLDAADKMFNPPLVHWDGSVNVEVIEEPQSTSGYAVRWDNSGVLIQPLYQKTLASENYIFSFRAKGVATMTARMGGVMGTIELDSANEFKRYVYPFVATETVNTFVLTLSDEVIMCEPQLERGTIATSWSNSYLDNLSDRAYYQAGVYVNQALHEGSTTIGGGLVLTNHIKVGNYANKEMIQETGGMQGSWTNDDDPFLWGGGTLEQAAKTVSQNGDGEDEANFVVTHGGKVILNDAKVRGEIIAKKGSFGDLKIGRYVNACGQTDAEDSVFTERTHSIGNMNYKTMVQMTSGSIRAFGTHHDGQTCYFGNAFEVDADSDANENRQGAVVRINATTVDAMLIEDGDVVQKNGCYRGFRPQMMVITDDTNLGTFDSGITIVADTTNASIYLDLAGARYNGSNFEIHKVGNGTLVIGEDPTNIYYKGQLYSQYTINDECCIKIIYSEQTKRWYMSIA